jgi:spore coat protein U-like protein
MKRVIIIVMAAAVVLLAGNAFAGSNTSQFTVTATVAGQCTVEGADIDFGTYVIDQSFELTATGSITVNCAEGVPYAVGLNYGSNSEGGDRSMADQTGNSFLGYQLYKPTADTTTCENGSGGVWGDASDAAGTADGSGNTPCTGTGSGQSQPYTVDATVPENQIGLSPGPHSDTVTATIFW